MKSCLPCVERKTVVIFLLTVLLLLHLHGRSSKKLAWNPAARQPLWLTLLARDLSPLQCAYEWCGVVRQHVRKNEYEILSFSIVFQAIASYCTVVIAEDHSFFCLGGSLHVSDFCDNLCLPLIGLLSASHDRGLVFLQCWNQGKVTREVGKGYLLLVNYTLVSGRVFFVPNRCLKFFNIFFSGVESQVGVINPLAGCMWLATYTNTF